MRLKRLFQPIAFLIWRTIRQTASRVLSTLPSRKLSLGAKLRLSRSSRCFDHGPMKAGADPRQVTLVTLRPQV